MSNTEIIYNGASSLISAEVDVQIATAHRFPRDIERFQKNCELAVISDLDTAASMTYLLTRESKKSEDKKEIIGPSIRFAEVIGQSWGNMRVAARILDIDEYFLTAQGAAWDLESNFAQSFERKSSIRYSTGGKYNTDMIKTTSNAASAIARREAILKTVPKAHWKKLHDKAQLFVLETSGEALKRNIQGAIDYFVQKKGIKLEAILKKLGKSEVSALDSEDLLVLRAIYTSVKDEGGNAAEAFADEEESASETRQEGLINRLKAKQAAEASAEPTDLPEKDREIEA